MSHSNFDHRHWVIISASDVSNIDFSQVMETSADTLRFSVDGTSTFVKYEGDMPSSVTACSSKSQECSRGGMLASLSGNGGVWWVEEAP